MFQLASNLEIHFIQKRRNIGATCCEFFSHFLILTLLVLGYNMSKILPFPSTSYDVVKVQIPPSFINKDASLSTYFPVLFNGTSNSNSNNDPSTTSASSTDDYYYFSNTNNGNNNLNGLVNFGAFVSSIQAALNGPIPIPTFDFYVTAAQLITAYAKGNDLVNLIDRTQVGQRFANLFLFGSLHFAPYPSVLVDDYINYMLNTTIKMKDIKIYKHATENIGVRYILDHLDEKAFALIVFRQISAEKINFVIRQNYTTLPNSNTIVTDTFLGLNTEYQEYYLSGFLTLQDSIDRWAFRYTGTYLSSSSVASNSSTSNSGSLFTAAIDTINNGNGQIDTSNTCATFPSLWAFPFPIYQYSQNPFYPQVGPLLGLALTMATLYPMSRLVKSIVEEKETKMREVLKIMGLNDSIHQLAWFITAFIVFFWIAFSSAAYTSITFLSYSNPAILFLYFFMFCMSLVSLCFLISVFFSNAKLAAIAAPVVLIFTLLPKYVFFGSENTEGISAKIAASLLSPTAFAFGADIIGEWVEEM